MLPSLSFFFVFMAILAGVNLIKPNKRKSTYSLTLYSPRSVNCSAICGSRQICTKNCPSNATVEIDNWDYPYKRYN